MSKIVQAVNSMISNSDNITNAIRGQDREIFFLYKDKYKWSMTRRNDGTHLLWFYPGNQSIEEMATYEPEDWEGTPMVVYKDEEIGTKEAKASFAELFTIITEKLYGINEVLDDIISDEDSR